MTRFLLYYHKEKSWARYVYHYGPLKKLSDRNFCKVEFHSLPQQNAHPEFAELPAPLRRLLFFAKPDLVICIDDGLSPIRPIFAIEVSTHVMARDHWMQRFHCLVGCAQEGVPGVYIMPGEMPDRPKFKGKKDPFFYFAYDRVLEIHQVPFYIATWTSSDGRTHDRDQKFADKPDHLSPDLKNTFLFLELVVEAAIHGRDFAGLMRNRLIVDLRNAIRREGYKQQPQIRDFDRLTSNMPGATFLTLAQVRGWIEAKGLAWPKELPDRIQKRKRNLIFAPLARPQANSRQRLIYRIKTKSGDPYTGQPLVFDYLFCRLGSTPYERDANLIIDLSVLSFSDLARFHRTIWEKSPLRHTNLSDIEHIPTYTLHLTEGIAQVMKNFLRLYAFSADIIVFRDGVVYF